MAEEQINKALFKLTDEETAHVIKEAAAARSPGAGAMVIRRAPTW